MVETWYPHLLRVWGIVLLGWAAVILGRDLLSMAFSGGERQGGGQLISDVIAVLLLVAGAAGLFVVIEFSRSLRLGLNKPVIRSQRFQPPPTPGTAIRLWRPWRHIPRGSERFPNPEVLAQTNGHAGH